MPRGKKKATETKPVVAGEESEAKKEFRAFIEHFKNTHSAEVWALNEESLLKQLNSL